MTNEQKNDSPAKILRGLYLKKSKSELVTRIMTQDFLMKEAILFLDLYAKMTQNEFAKNTVEILLKRIKMVIHD